VTTSIAPFDLLDLSRDQLAGLVASWGFKPVHAARIWRHIYGRGRSDWEALTTLPPALRVRLAAETSAALLPVARETHSRDGFTRKYLLRLRDGHLIETVLMRYRGRVTACISSQVGCAMGCVFCATGQMGFTRHLTPGEIVAQALHVDRVLRETATEAPALADPAHDSPHHRHERLRNIVLMGMGEPLHNYDAVMAAVDILRDQSGLALAASRITVSTVGVVPGIRRLTAERRPINLAVSLHAATQAGRAALVPAARAWNLEALMAACWDYVRALDPRIFFEWTLIAGENDSPAHAHEVGRLLRGMKCQVNLIPLNPTAGYDGAPTADPAARAFQAILAGYDLPSTIRQRRGIDIDAGCGQLAVAAAAR
jgi:23S rRNA (adenine2503-C2)-methyltransferase